MLQMLSSCQPDVHAIVHALYLQVPVALLDRGIDILGKVSPKGTGEHKFVLVVIDYFTKWAEEAAYTTLTSKKVVRFIK